MTLVAAFGVCLKILGMLYLVEAMNKEVVFPFQEDTPQILDLTKWATIFVAMNWTSVYSVKFDFLSIRTSEQTRREIRANTLEVLCGLAHRHLKHSVMPFFRKLSLAAMLCLSIAMIICAIIRLVGPITDTRPDGSATAPVWSTFWAITEGCISLIMTSVIIIRGVFIAQVIRDDRRRQDSLIQRFGRRLLSTWRHFESSRSNSRSPPRPTGDQFNSNSSAPRIPTQGLTRATLSNGRGLCSSGNNKSEGQDNVLETVDTASALGDLDYRVVQRNEARRLGGLSGWIILALFQNGSRNIKGGVARQSPDRKVGRDELADTYVPNFRYCTKRSLALSRWRHRCYMLGRGR
ncbi:hypothetical protein DL770_002564 [Monosporascus sp. CRB-9-2]|nr:hypothetical protein DL770_002564 [Monosporascus sp. CRB-9-2]